MANLTVKIVPAMFRDRTTCPGILRKKDVPILAKWGDKEMWVVPGGYYCDRLGKHSLPGYVVLVTESDKEWKHAYSTGKTEISQTAHLREKLFIDNAAKIEKFFGGAAIAHLLRKGRTVLIEEAVTSVSHNPQG